MCTNLHENPLVVQDGVEGLAGRLVRGRRVVQIHAKCYVDGSGRTASRDLLGRRPRDFLAFPSVRAVELGGDKTNIRSDCADPARFLNDNIL